MAETIASASAEAPDAMVSASGEPTSLGQSMRFTISRGSDFYGIWDLSAPVPELVGRFPLDADGLLAAQRHVEALERPDRAAAIPPTTPVPTPPTTTPGGRYARQIHAGMILIGVTLGVAGMFPAYLGGSALTSQAAELLPHIAYVATWAAVASLLLLDTRFRRAAAGIGVGLSVMTFGFFLTDAATAASSHGVGAGAGLYLSIAGWVAATSGCVAALLALRSSERVGRPDWNHPFVAFGGALGLAIAAAFALPWDRYVLTAGASGTAETITAGNVFANPGAVIAANLVVMTLTFAVLLGAFAWRPVVLGATFLVGSLVPLAAQLFSTIVQAKPPLSSFGISAADAAEGRVTLNAGYTGWFYAYCALIAIVVLMLGWVATYAPRESSD